jgi:CheY-like chemotaxis protein
MQRAAVVLVVDDETPLAQEWADHLARLGYEIQDVCGSGEEAIASVATRAPDIALVDISLARSMTGVEAAAHMRLWAPEIQIVFCSAYAPGEVPGLGMLPKGFLYLEKPFTKERLALAVAEAASRHASATPAAGFSTMAISSDDHDLLVRLDTKLDLLSVQVNEVRVQVASKADMSTIEPRIAKIEARLDSQQRTVYMMLGGLAVLEVFLKFLKSGGG